MVRAAGAGREVLGVGELPDPAPGPGEVRIRIGVSGINPGDVKKRGNAFGYGMPYPRVIPHSDGAGTVDAVGAGVAPEWLGRQVWCYGAQSYRPFGTAADEAPAHRAGADLVLTTGAELIEQVRAHAPNGVDHLVDVAFGANIATDCQLLALGGSIAAYATDNAQPRIPFWELLFKNVRIFLIGSDDVPPEAKVAAARELNAALAAGWVGFEIAERLPLEEIARAHELVEHPVRRGRVVLSLGERDGATDEMTGDA